MPQLLVSVCLAIKVDLFDGSQLCFGLFAYPNCDALEWPDGEEFSALWLSQLPDIGFSNATFRNAMEALAMSLDGMAAALGVSRRQIADYRKDKPIPRHIALATRYLLEHAQKSIA